MGKMTYAVTLAFIVELSLYLWGGPQFFSPVFSWLFHLDSYASSILWITITLALGVVAASSIVPAGNLFFNVYGMYAKIAFVFIFMVVPLIGLWGFINNSLSGIGGIGLSSSSWVIASLIVVPLFLSYIFLTLDWVRGTDN